MCIAATSWTSIDPMENQTPRTQGIDMRRNLIATLAITFSVFAVASPAFGQGYESAVGWSGGVFFPTALNDGAVEGGDFEMKPDPVFTMNVHYDHWMGSGHFGIRGAAGLSRPTIPWVQGDREIRVFLMDLGILLRPLAPDSGRTVLPFLNGGGGLIMWELGDGPPTSYDPAGVSYDGDENFDYVAAVGAGLDFITPWKWGEGPLVIRLEGRDFIQFESPFDPANQSDEAFGMIHNFSVVLGFHTGMGYLDGR